MKELWKLYRVRLDFVTSLCASVPANEDLVKSWLDARKPAVRPPQARGIDEIQEEVLGTLIATAEDEQSKSLLVFQRVDGKLVERTATFRAHLKDCCRQVGVYYVGKIKGERAFSTRFIQCVYHDERQYWTPILQTDGTPFTEATGRRDKPVHTWRGDSSLKTIEYVENARVEFRVKVLGDGVSERDLNTVFSYGAVHGYGGERGDGEGRYIFSIEPEGNNAERGT